MAFFFFAATLVSGIPFIFSKNWTNFPVLVWSSLLKNFFETSVTTELCLNFLMVSITCDFSDP